MKEIKGFHDYYADKNGIIYSCKNNNNMKPIAQWKDGRGRYLLVHIIDDNGYAKNVLVHRIIGETFIPNQLNLPEINHKDNNPKNNCVTNLEWCTRKENLMQSYKPMSPVRNFKTCKLYKNGKFISDFQSINEACRFASTQYNASYSMLNKHRKWRDIEILTK